MISSGVKKIGQPIFLATDITYLALLTQEKSVAEEVVVVVEAVVVEGVVITIKSGFTDPGAVFCKRCKMYKPDASVESRNEVIGFDGAQ